MARPIDPFFAMTSETTRSRGEFLKDELNQCTLKKSTRTKRSENNRAALGPACLACQNKLPTKELQFKTASR